MEGSPPHFGEFDGDTAAREGRTSQHGELLVPGAGWLRVRVRRGDVSAAGCASPRRTRAALGGSCHRGAGTPDLPARWLAGDCHASLAPRITCTPRITASPADAGNCRAWCHTPRHPDVRHHRVHRVPVTTAAPETRAAPSWAAAGTTALTVSFRADLRPARRLATYPSTHLATYPSTRLAARPSTRLAARPAAHPATGRATRPAAHSAAHSVAHLGASALALALALALATESNLPAVPPARGCRCGRARRSARRGSPTDTR